jgi:hypothetical protein
MEDLRCRQASLTWRPFFHILKLAGPACRPPAYRQAGGPDRGRGRPRTLHGTGQAGIPSGRDRHAGAVSTELSALSMSKGLPEMEPHGQSPWYFHVLRRNPPKHTLLRTRLRRVILFVFIHGHRPCLHAEVPWRFCTQAWSSA